MNYSSIIESNAYRLLQPFHICEKKLEHVVNEEHVAIEPTLASICHADLRYYTGQRRPEALANKLPMALIHEGIGTVKVSRSMHLKAGDRVVIVPNLPGYLLEGIAREQCCDICRKGISTNYCKRGRFLGSGMDGIAQSRLVIPAPCAILIPEEVPDEIAVLAELCSVSLNALHRVQDRLQAHTTAAVFGDGPVGYLTAAMLHHAYGFGHERLQAFGAIPDKLDQFTFADRALVQDYDFSCGNTVDIAVECTGGQFSEQAINQAIDLLRPGGCLILMGVSEDRIPINTRDILEKGITVIGSSRSSVDDFHQALDVMRDISCQTTLQKLLPDQGKPIHSVDDFVAAMEETAAHRGWKKTLLHFHW